MAIAPWSVLEGGGFKTRQDREAGLARGRLYPGTKHQPRVAEALEKVAERKGAEITHVALAYVMHKTPYVFPVVGGRTTEQLKQNIQALKVKLSRQDLVEIEEAAPFDRGFPYNILMLDDTGIPEDVSGILSYNDLPQNRAYGHVRVVSHPPAIQGGNP